MRGLVDRGGGWCGVGRPALLAGITVVTVCVLLYTSFDAQSSARVYKRSRSNPLRLFRWNFSSRDIRKAAPRNASSRSSIEIGRTCQPYEPPADLHCKPLFDGERRQILDAQDWQSGTEHDIDAILNLLKDCDSFKQRFCFPSKALSAEERDHPLAFLLIVHNHFEQVLRLLQAIYWPQNLYCLTYDLKSEPKFQKFVRKLAGCFPDNIVLPEKHEIIWWGQMGVLQAAVNCLTALDARAEHGWVHAQIISWSDLPLRTNLEMVRVSTILNETNDNELKRGQAYRYLYKAAFSPANAPLPKTWKERHNVITGIAGNFYMNRSRPQAPLPAEMTVYKGSFAATLHRRFVGWLLRDAAARRYLVWLNETMIPDEQYWSTLMHNSRLGAPGSLPGKVCISKYGRRDVSKPWISRFQIWPDGEFNCGGKWVHGSCVFGVRDLAVLSGRKELVAHKFYLSYQPAAFHCLLALVQRRAYAEAQEDSLDRQFYESLPAVKYSRLLDKSEFDCN